MNNILKFNTNEILNHGAYCNNENIYDYSDMSMKNIIRQNILKDTKGGIRTLEINVFLVNIKNINGDTIKNYENGSIINIGEICELFNNDDTPKYLKNNKSIKWKVLSRTFDFQGQPLMTLTLQEIKN